MIAFALMLAMLATPAVFWFAGLEAAAVYTGLFVICCVPSMIYVCYLSIKTRSWPRISGGPGITFAGRRFGSG